MGNESGVSLDLSHGFNRIVDTWFDLFNGGVQQHMPQFACAYPGNFDEQMISDVRNNASIEHQSLRWNQNQHATDSSWETRRLFSTIGWDLMVSWEGVTYMHTEPVDGQDGLVFYKLIDNAQAYVNLTDASSSLSLNVEGSFGHPTFENHIARLPVWFHVTVHDGTTPIRDEHRGFDLFGDGLRIRVA